MQPFTWAKKLFEKEKKEVPSVKETPQLTHAVTDRYVVTTQIQTDNFPVNSMASSLEKHTKIPGLFIQKKEKSGSRSKIVKASSMKRLDAAPAPVTLLQVLCFPF